MPSLSKIYPMLKKKKRVACTIHPRAFIFWKNFCLFRLAPQNRINQTEIAVIFDWFDYIRQSNGKSWVIFDWVFDYVRQSNRNHSIAFNWFGVRLVRLTPSGPKETQAKRVVFTSDHFLTQRSDGGVHLFPGDFLGIVNYGKGVFEKLLSMTPYFSMLLWALSAHTYICKIFIYDDTVRQCF